MVSVTNTHILWNGLGSANPGLWNGLLPVSSFSNDGINLLPGLSYLNGSSIVGATGARLYWNFLEILFESPFPFGGAAAGGGHSNHQQQQEELLTLSNYINTFSENKIRVYVSEVAAMLSEQKQQMHRLAKINITGVDTKVLPKTKNVEVLIENLKLHKQKKKKVNNVTAKQFINEIFKKK